MDVLLRGARRLGFEIGENQVFLFQRYLQELVEWNKNINLTTIIDSTEVQSKHFLDSLTVSSVMSKEVLAGGALIDIGSGAGFPGLPLKIVWPHLRVTLVESVGKKVAFLRNIKDVLCLDGLDIHWQRAESLAHDHNLRGTFDIVTSRAVASLSVLAELALPFCKVGGKVIAMKKSGISDEIDRSETAISILGGVLESVEVVDLDEIGESRWLIVLTKKAISPPRYPRRPGTPARRPL